MIVGCILARMRLMTVNHAVGSYDNWVILAVLGSGGSQQ